MSQDKTKVDHHPDFLAWMAKQAKKGRSIIVASITARLERFSETGSLGEAEQYGKIFGMKNQKCGGSGWRAYLGKIGDREWKAYAGALGNDDGEKSKAIDRATGLHQVDLNVKNS